MDDWIASMFKQFDGSIDKSESKVEESKKEEDKKLSEIDIEEKPVAKELKSDEEPLVIEINTKPACNTVESYTELRDEALKFLNKCSDGDLDYIVKKINAIKHYRELEKKYGPHTEFNAIIRGYLHNDKFYEDDLFIIEIPQDVNKIYIDLLTNCTYRYSSYASRYIEIPN